MDFLPVFFNIRDRECLVVGGGSVAARKSSTLAAAGAKVAIVAPDACTEIQNEAKQGNYQWIQRAFVAEDLDNKALAIAATDDQAVNQEVSRLAQARNLPVNVVDNPELCSFIMPSMIDRSPVQIAISTGGASPVLARMLRTRLEASIPAGYGNLAALVERYREKVKRALPSVDLRKNFWEEVLEGPVAELSFGGKTAEAEAALEEAIENASQMLDKPQGEVYLVGAGPGDPDLLTLRALRLMQKADVVVYDRLVSKSIMELVRRDAEKIYVGKARADHAVPQEGINQILVRLAKEGKRVLRLKGGDPFIFGRGGEEISELAENGVNFQVVPGITAAAGCAAYAGIPLTHRDYSQSVTFVTGHRKQDGDSLNWPSLAAPQQTLVFYMGLHCVETLCSKLIAHGRDPETPAALVEKGTQPDQKVYVGKLGTLPELVKQQDVKPPTLIIVGEVVDLHNQLKWFKPDEIIT